MSKKRKKTTNVLLIVLSIVFLLAGVSFLMAKEELKQDGALLGDKFESEDGVVQGTKLNGKWDYYWIEDNGGFSFENCNYSAVFNHEVYRWNLEPVSFAVDVDFDGFEKEYGFDLREEPAAKVVLYYYDTEGKPATLEKQLNKDLYFYEKDLLEYGPYSIFIEIDKDYLSKSFAHVSWLVDYYVSIKILN